MADDRQRVNSVLDRYSQLDFVKRLRNPSQYPVLLHDNDNGYGTMEMSYSTIDNGAMVYPNIVHQPVANRLIRLSPQDAQEYAIKTGEFIPFDKVQDAEWFSDNNYKKAFSDADWKSMEDKAKEQRGKESPFHFSL